MSARSRSGAFAGSPRAHAPQPAAPRRARPRSARFRARPAFLGAALDEDASELGEDGLLSLVRPVPAQASDLRCGLVYPRRFVRRTTSFGHFTRAASPTTSQTATPAINDSNAWRVPQHERAQQRAAWRRQPGASLPSTPGALLVGCDRRAVRRPGDRQSARSLVGGVGATQVYARMTERACLGIRHYTASASRASTSPSMSWRSAST